jgi:hypothetical protein
VFVVGVLDIAESFSGDFFVHHSITVHRIGWFRIIMSSTTSRESKFGLIIYSLTTTFEGLQPNLSQETRVVVEDLLFSQVLCLVD